MMCQRCSEDWSCSFFCIFPGKGVGHLNTKMLETGLPLGSVVPGPTHCCSHRCAAAAPSPGPVTAEKGASEESQAGPWLWTSSLPTPPRPSRPMPVLWKKLEPSSRQSHRVAVGDKHSRSCFGDEPHLSLSYLLAFQAPFSLSP